jgi:hypothetical protein
VISLVGERVVESTDGIEDPPADEEIGGGCGARGDCALLIQEHVDIEERPEIRAWRQLEAHETGNDICVLESLESSLEPFRLG